MAFRLLLFQASSTEDVEGIEVQASLVYDIARFGGSHRKGGITE